MWLYLLIFLIPVVAYFTTKDTGNVRDKKFLAVFLAGIALFVGMSDMFGGYDRYIYSEVFDGIADITDSGGNYLTRGAFTAFESETGWTFLNIFISYFTANRYIFILTITLITYTLLFVSLKRYATNYPLALIFFFGLWFFFTFTYLRQVLSATFVWLSLPYIIKRKLWKFLIFAFLGMTLHKSAAIFVPVYFLVHRTYSRGGIITLMVIALVIGISPIPNMVFTTYGDLSQVEMTEDYNSSGGFRVAYFLEALFFLWLLLKDYDRLRATMSMERRVLFNIALLFCVTLLFFVRSENGGRLSWYYIIGILCTTPTLVERSFDRRSMASLMIVLSLFLYIRIYNSWQHYLNLYPYKTFLTNGYRSGDYSWQHYEYNHTYDLNKLCRPTLRLKFNANGLWPK